MKESKEFVKKITDIPKVEGSKAYNMGFDCGLNGANTTNCHFSIFQNQTNTKEWERGKKNAEKRGGQNEDTI